MSEYAQDGMAPYCQTWPWRTESAGIDRDSNSMSDQVMQVCTTRNGINMAAPHNGSEQETHNASLLHLSDQNKVGCGMQGCLCTRYATVHMQCPQRDDDKMDAMALDCQLHHSLDQSSSIPPKAPS